MDPTVESLRKQDTKHANVFVVLVNDGTFVFIIAVVIAVFVFDDILVANPADLAGNLENEK